jgi:HD-GYP domain-containing protein (c-di-GMP phosphodiesterase class II)
VLTAALLPALVACVGAAVGAFLSFAPWAVGARADPWLLWGPLLLGVAASLAAALVFARSLWRLLLTPLAEVSDRALELAQGDFGVQVRTAGGDLTGLVQTFNYMSNQLLAYAEENKRLYGTLEDGYLETIVALANSLDSKDAYTRGHSQRVGDLSVEIGRELGLPESELRLLRYGGILHDIGKIGIVESILHKSSRLTEQEMAVMREHPMIGDAIVGPIRFLNPVRAAIRHHHERFDGSGYPDRLSGDEIPLIARVVACADTFDACTSQRPYQPAMSHSVAMEIVSNLSGKQLDPRVVEALARVVQREAAATPVPLAS